MYFFEQKLFSNSIDTKKLLYFFSKNQIQFWVNLTGGRWWTTWSTWSEGATECDRAEYVKQYVVGGAKITD